ncbi:MAG: ECF transporter S component [Candidatus Verstraetearchaeota archaeon]|nr:ECF transporter S component [Candidatus Verstraetearchaeota archaeon]
MNGKISNVQKITYTSILIALAASLRIVKYSIFGPMQFISFPGIFTILGGVLFGPVTGGVVGVASYLISDIMIGMPGPWTPVNCMLMGAVGFGSGLIWGKREKVKISRTGMMIGTYLLMFIFDVASSWILLMLIMGNAFEALIVGLLGLFMPNPTAGGWMFAVGPITEFTTASVLTMLVQVLSRSKVH